MALIALFAAPAHANFTYFKLDSTPGSWVGQGFTNYLVSPATGWAFSASRLYDKGVSISITSTNPNAPTNNHYWTLELDAPNAQPIEKGLYSGAARWPFNRFDQPGLTLSGNHRGNNRNAGFFEVLEAVYRADGSVERFAVNFTQLGEERQDWIDKGEVRFNSTLPEPVALPTLLICAMLWRGRRARSTSVKNNTGRHVSRPDRRRHSQTHS